MSRDPRGGILGNLRVLSGKSGAEGAPLLLALHMLDSGMEARALLQAPQAQGCRHVDIHLVRPDPLQFGCFVPTPPSIRAGAAFTRQVLGRHLDV